MTITGPIAGPIAGRAPRWKEVAERRRSPSPRPVRAVPASPRCALPEAQRRLELFPLHVEGPNLTPGGCRLHAVTLVQLRAASQVSCYLAPSCRAPALGPGREGGRCIEGGRGRVDVGPAGVARLSSMGPPGMRPPAPALVPRSPPVWGAVPSQHSLQPPLLRSCSPSRAHGPAQVPSLCASVRARQRHAGGHRRFLQAARVT